MPDIYCKPSPWLYPVQGFSCVNGSAFTQAKRVMTRWLFQCSLGFFVYQQNQNIMKSLLLITLLPLALVWERGNEKKIASREYAVNYPTSSSVLDAAIRDEIAKQNVVGCAVAVMEGGKITFTKAFGHHDLKRTKAVKTTDVFRWASISKTITAVAAFKAIESNKMTVTSQAGKLATYWPTSDNKGKITIEQLMSHRSGITHYGNDENGVKLGSYNQSSYKAKNNFNAQQCVDVFDQVPLLDEPGKTHCYSTFGYNLLGACVEAATGIAYEKYVDDNIADKAGMSSLSPYASSPGGYEKDCNQELKSENEGNTEWKLPGGGWSSNISDLGKFMAGLANGNFLSNTSALWTTSYSSNSSYSRGMKNRTWSGQTFVSHGGAHDDVRTFLGFFPGSKDGVAVMINGGAYIDVEKFARAILQAMGNVSGADLSPRDWCGSGTNCGYKTVGIWQASTNTEVNQTILRQGYTTDEFGAEYDFMLGCGYYPEDIETWLDGSVRKWSGIFKKKTTGTAMWRNFSFDGFGDKWREMSDDGYRLLDLEAYKEGTVTKFAGTFVQSDDRYALFRGFKSDDFSDKHKEMQDKEYQLIDVETYMDGTVRKWCGVWKGKGKSLLNRNYNTDDFQQLCSDREKAGYTLTDVETYVDGTVRKWAGVWIKTGKDEVRTWNQENCDQVATHNQRKASKYVLMDIERY